jgi:membrane-associated phospholipid phosphatase
VSTGMDRLTAPGNIRLTMGGFLLTANLVLLSHEFLDERIALWAYRLARSLGLLSLYTARIPSLLLPAVLILSGVMWALYLRGVRRGDRDDRSAFFLLTGITMPATFLAKVALKHVFGRMSPRAWLEHPTDLSFHWFHGGGDLTAFPSGHMAVFTALAVACWLFFPKARAACVAGIVAMGVALIVTGQHFLSDLIAGGYVGWVVFVCTDRGLALLGGAD